jgi:hypothetical protein
MDELENYGEDDLIERIREIVNYDNDEEDDI